MKSYKEFVQGTAVSVRVLFIVYEIKETVGFPDAWKNLKMNSFEVLDSVCPFPDAWKNLKMNSFEVLDSMCPFPDAWKNFKMNSLEVLDSVCPISRCLKKFKNELFWGVRFSVSHWATSYFLWFIFKVCEPNIALLSKSGLAVLTLRTTEILVVIYDSNTTWCNNYLVFQLSFLCNWKLNVITFARFWNIKTIYNKFLRGLVTGATVCSNKLHQHRHYKQHAL